MGVRRRAGVLVAGLVATLLALPLLAVPAAAAAQPFDWLPGISVSPGRGAPGTKVRVSGHGFDATLCGGVVRLRWRGGAGGVVTAPIRADGTFAATVRAPERRMLRTTRLRSWCVAGPLLLPGPSARFGITTADAVTPRPPARPPAQPPAKPPADPAPEPPSRPDPGGGSGGGSGGGASDGRGTGGGTSGGASENSGAQAGAGGSSSASEDAASGRPAISVVPTDAPAPTATPAPSPAPTAGERTAAAGPVRATGPPAGEVRPANVTGTVPTAFALDLDPAVALAAAVLALLLVALIAFPADVFNGTYDANAEEIHALAQRFGRSIPGVSPAAAKAAVSPAFVLFVVAGTVLSALLAGDEGGGNRTAQVLGLLIAIPVVTLAFELPAEAVARRWTGIEGSLRVLGPAIVVAVVSAIASRLLGLQPAYLYGLFAGYAAARARTLTRKQEGQAVLAAAASLIATGLVAWLLWSWLHRLVVDGGSWPAVVLDAALFWVFALAAEGLVFALVPLRFLDGSALWQWRPLAWLLPQLVAAGFFCYVFVLRGQLTFGQLGSAPVLRALAFFALFGLASFAFWAWFRWDDRPGRVREPEDEPATVG